MRSNSEFVEMVISGTTPTGGDTGGVPEAAITSPVLSTISRGSRDLPVACAGHTAVQRPQIVQASVSSRCFQVTSSTVDVLKVSSSVSIRFGMARMAPLGRSRSLRYMLSGDVTMWRNMVVDPIRRKAKKPATWTTQDTRCQFDNVPADQPFTRPVSG